MDKRVKSIDIGQEALEAQVVVAGDAVHATSGFRFPGQPDKLSVFIAKRVYKLRKFRSEKEIEVKEDYIRVIPIDAEKGTFGLRIHITSKFTESHMGDYVIIVKYEDGEDSRHLFEQRISIVSIKTKFKRKSTTISMLEAVNRLGGTAGVIIVLLIPMFLAAKLAGVSDAFLEIVNLIT